MQHAECSINISHAAPVDIVVEIAGHGKVISIISTKNHDMLLFSTYNDFLFLCY